MTLFSYNAYDTDYCLPVWQMKKLHARSSVSNADVGSSDDERNPG
jgi:hypothetical protein